MSPVVVDDHDGRPTRVVTWRTFNHWRRQAIAAYVILLLSLVVATWAGYRANATEQQRICQASYGARTTLHRLVERARVAALHNPDLSPVERARDTRFYADALRDIPLTPCPP